MSLFFGRKHILKTVVVFVFVALFVRLGIWQIERHQWRQALNAELAAQLAQPPFLLNAVTDENALLAMSDRRVTVRGTFDFSEQVVVRNRNEPVLGPGVHLLTPYVLEGSARAVLVDRGWISSAEYQADAYAQYDSDSAEISGVVKQSENLARNAQISSSALTELFQIHIPQLQTQSQYELLPIYVLQTSDGKNIDARPYQAPHTLDLSPGNHLSYVVQWFSFAIIFLVGYIVYLRRYNN